ncbi:hypothetical protein NC651_021905 [Populus alba x Populus x berolinensis]|nr:hypothetical protein NC651_021905 [Populus alba x Populus x berolinensis]
MRRSLFAFRLFVFLTGAGFRDNCLGGFRQLSLPGWPSAPLAHICLPPNNHLVRAHAL